MATQLSGTAHTNAPDVLGPRRDAGAEVKQYGLGDVAADAQKQATLLSDQVYRLQSLLRTMAGGSEEDGSEKDPYQPVSLLDHCYHSHKRTGSLITELEQAVNRLEGLL